MSSILLGLGTNLGNRGGNLRQAVSALESGITVSLVSPIYETSPWGKIDQPPFLNMCLRGVTELGPHELLAFVKGVEVSLGRTPAEKWGPRIMDIDILAYDQLILHTQSLTIPHRFMEQRAFVLAPLNDIAPEWRHPKTGASVAEMLALVDRSGVRLLAADLTEI